MSAIEAVVFDADGTILDTRELIYQAYEHVLRTHEYEVPNRTVMFEHVRGNAAEITYAILVTNRDTATLVAMHKQFQRERLDLWAAYEGLHELLASIRDAGIKIGLCTSRGQGVMPMLEHFSIVHYFDAIVHGDMVANHKPHPEPLLKVLAEMNIDPKDAVMVGDTDADIGAGKAAEVAFTIGMTHGVGTKERLENCGADFLVDHLNGVLPLIFNYGK